LLISARLFMNVSEQNAAMFGWSRLTRLSGDQSREVGKSLRLGKERPPLSVWRQTISGVNLLYSIRRAEVIGFYCTTAVYQETRRGSLSYHNQTITPECRRRSVRVPRNNTRDETQVVLRPDKVCAYSCCTVQSTMDKTSNSHVGPNQVFKMV